MKNFFYIFLALIFISCEKELDFKYHEITPQIVIEGILSEDKINVSITHTTPMNEAFSDERLTDAIVFLRDETDSDYMPLTLNAENYFTSITESKPGHTYILKVQTEGKEFTSSCVMREAPQILGLAFQWIKMPYDEVAVLQITFSDFDTPDDCYWLKIFRNDEPYTWIISDDRSAVNGVINEVIMTTRKNLEEEDEKDILRDGDVVKVAINTISREMYDYLIAIENDSNGPAMFTGDFCLGYFLASTATTDSIIFHPDEIPLYK